MSKPIRPLTRAETAALAATVRALLDDDDANLSRESRLRWEGALTALERVLGLRSTLGGDGSEPFLL